MDAALNTGRLIYEQSGQGIERDGGTEVVVHSLDELFALVTQATSPHLIKTLILEGRDPTNQNCRITFNFQSITTYD